MPEDMRAFLREIKEHLIRTFEEVDTWFDIGPALLTYRPKSGGWTAAEVLEHIGLTSHFLLIIIGKATDKALRNAQQRDLATELSAWTFQREKLTEVGLHRSFNWIRPEHMEPKGERTLPEVRQQLKAQLAQCLAYLEQLPNGEGILYRTTMTVNDLGKITVYEYIHFLAQHAARHVQQMERNAHEYDATPKA